MITRILVTTAVAALMIALPRESHAGRRDTNESSREVTLNKPQAAALRVALDEMRRRGWGESVLRRWQIVIEDEGKTYNVAFMEDPIRGTGGEGMSWDIRKSDMKIVRGPTLYR
jgi:hypothetical protein